MREDEHPDLPVRLNLIKTVRSSFLPLHFISPRAGSCMHPSALTPAATRHIFSTWSARGAEYRICSFGVASGATRRPWRERDRPTAGRVDLANSFNCPPRAIPAHPFVRSQSQDYYRTNIHRIMGDRTVITQSLL